MTPPDRVRELATAWAWECFPEYGDYAARDMSIAQYTAIYNAGLKEGLEQAEKLAEALKNYAKEHVEPYHDIGPDYQVFPNSAQEALSNYEEWKKK